MSFILDALRRAEAERQRGGVPGLHDQPAMAPSGAAPSLAQADERGAMTPVLWSGAGLLLVAALTVAWWLGSGGVQPVAPTTAALPAKPPMVLQQAPAPRPDAPLVMPDQPVAVQALWRKHLGVEVEIEFKEWTAYLLATQTLDYDIVASGWIGDFIDPLTFLEIWSPGNGNNNTGWDNKEFVEKLSESFQVTAPAARYDLLKQTETIMLNDAPIAPIAWRGKNYLLHPSVKGWYPLLLDSHPYNSVELVPQETKRK